MNLSYYQEHKEDLTRLAGLADYVSSFGGVPLI